MHRKNIRRNGLKNILNVILTHAIMFDLQFIRNDINEHLRLSESAITSESEFSNFDALNKEVLCGEQMFLLLQEI